MHDPFFINEAFKRAKMMLDYSAADGELGTN